MTTPNDNQGYKKLKIYRLAHDLAVRVHKMTVELPKFEMMEDGGGESDTSIFKVRFQ